MCLTIDNKHKGKTATEDIVCYKVLIKAHDADYYYSPFQFYRYEMGETYKGKLLRIVDTIDVGFHTFINELDAMEFLTRLSFKNLCICKMIIPKDAKYYEGTFELQHRKYPSYASNEIVFPKTNSDSIES